MLGSMIALATGVALAGPSKEVVLASKLRAAAALIDHQLPLEAVPGAAIGLVHDQELVWTHTYGVESLETGTAVTSDTRFSICSVSKLFTSVAAMDLVESGGLDLDAPVSAILGDVSPRDTTGSEEPLTVRNLLTHVSGLPREGNRDYWLDHSFPDDAAFLEQITDNDQLYRPYDHWQYSNVGMALLGRIVAEASDQAWGERIQQQVLTPLGMSQTTTDMPFDQVGNGFAQGYYVRNGQGRRAPAPAHTFRSFAPAAGIASSVHDMARFASWHFRLLENGGEEVLRATTLRSMLRVHWMGPELDEPAWGLGYGVAKVSGDVLWGHGGYCPGTRTSFLMRLPTRVGVVMMLTANDVAPGHYVRAVYDLAGPLLGKPDETSDPARKRKRKKANAKAWEPSDYEGVYVEQNYPSDRYVGIDEDGLFVMSLYGDTPTENLQTWVHVEGDTFRRKRKNDELAEPITFERDEAGNVVALVQHGYRSLRR